MKKRMLFMLTALLSLTALRAQTCDTVSVFPWTEDIEPNYGCWTQLGGSDWTLNPIAGTPAFYSYMPSSTDKLVASPLLAFPSEMDVPAMRLSWRTWRSYNAPTYHVLVTEDMVNFDTLFTQSDSPSGAGTGDVSLAAYAGQQVRVVFAMPAQTTHTSFYIYNIEISSDSVPSGTVTASSSSVAIGDTVHLSAHLDRGRTPDVTFQWHSDFADAGLATINATDSAATIVYLAEGVDSVSVTATNVYGSSTMGSAVNAYDCAVTLPWSEDFLPVGGRYSVCWDISGWSNQSAYFSSGLYTDLGEVVNRNRFMSAGSVGSYMISPAIPIPATGVEHLALWVQSARNLQVRISTQGAADTALFNDTVVDIVGQTNAGGVPMLCWTMINLADYAGQTIHVMLRKMAGYSPYVACVAVMPERPLVSFVPPSTVWDTATAVYTVRQVHGLDDSASFAWHSTMVDAGLATAVAAADTLRVDYLYGGTDTVTVTATNSYGADTVVRTVTVVQCDNRPLPFEEDFSGISVQTTVSNMHIQLSTWSPQPGDTLVPGCWTTAWGGMARYQPFVVTPADIQQLNWTGSLSSNALLMEAGTYGGYDTLAYVVLPGFDLPLGDLTLVVDHMQESANHGTLTAGYMQGDVFTAVADLTDTNRIVSDTVSYASVSVPGAHMALRWECADSWWGAAVERVEVMLADQSSIPPTAVIDGVTPVRGLVDTLHLSARLRYGDPNGLSYTWRSAMADAGHAVLTVSGEEASIVYTAVGTDTVNLVAVTAFGTDTARATVQVFGSPVASIAGLATVYTEDTVDYVANLNSGIAVGLACAWHSTMEDAGLALITNSDDTLSIVYLAGGTDTLTLTLANALGSTQVQRTVNVTGHIRTFPYNEGFEAGLGGHWRRWCNNSDEWMHKWSTVSYSWLAHSGSKSMFSQNLTGETDTTEDWLLMPPVDLPSVDSLSLDFYVWYMGSPNAGAYPRLTVLASTQGRGSTALFTDTLFTEQTHTGSTGTQDYVPRSVSLADYAGQTVWIAFVHGHKCMNLSLDDISIDGSGRPVVAVGGPTSVLSCNDAVFNATLLVGDTAGLVYTWHSAMADAGLATLTAQADTAWIDYHAGGTDTVRVTAVNAAGSHSDSMRCRVTDCEPIVSLPYTAPLTTAAQTACWVLTSGPGDYSGTWWLSGGAMQSELVVHNPTNEWLISQAITLPDSVAAGDSIRLGWHVSNDHGVYEVRLSTAGRASLALFTDSLYAEAAVSTGWQTRTADLTPYAGQTVHVAFRSRGLNQVPVPDYSDAGLIRIDTVQVYVAHASAPDTVWHTVGVSMAMLDGTALSAGQWEDYECSVSGAGVYAEGDTATLTAVDQYPVYFHGWYADSLFLSGAYTFSFVVTSDTTITAVYAWHQGISPLPTLLSPLSLYPNPAGSTVTVDCAEGGEAVVYTVGGVEAMRFRCDSGRNTVDIRCLPQGVYFLRLGSDHAKMQVSR